MCIGRLRNLVAWLSATVRSDRPATEMLPMSTVKTVIRIDARIAETTNAARRVQRRAAARLTPRTLVEPGVDEGSETAGVLASCCSANRRRPPVREEPRSPLQLTLRLTVLISFDRRALLHPGWLTSFRSRFVVGRRSCPLRKALSTRSHLHSTTTRRRPDSTD
jgi:hypothetical protein